MPEMYLGSDAVLRAAGSDVKAKTEIGLRLRSYFIWPNDEAARKSFLARMGALLIQEAQEPRGDAWKLMQTIRLMSTSSSEAGRIAQAAYAQDALFSPSGGFMGLINGPSRNEIAQTSATSAREAGCAANQLHLVYACTLNSEIGPGASLNLVRHVMTCKATRNRRQLELSWKHYRSIAPIVMAYRHQLHVAWAALDLARENVDRDGNRHIQLNWEEFYPIQPHMILTHGVLELLALAQALQIWASTFFPHGRQALSAALIPIADQWLVPSQLKLPSVPLPKICLPSDFLAAAASYRAPKRTK